VSLVVLTTIAVIWALQWTKVFMIPLAVAIFATFWLMPMVDWLYRVRIPRALGAAIVLATMVAGLGGAGYALRDDARDFLNGLAEATQQTRIEFNQAVRDPNGWLHHIRNTLTDRTQSTRAGVVASTADNPLDVQFSLVRGSTTLAAAAVDVVVVLFLIYLLLASGDLFKRKLLVVISGQLARRRVTVEILNQIAVQFQRYLGVLVSTNVAIGLLTWGLFAALGVQHAAIWGVAAGILHIVPYLGPAVVAAASLLVTSTQFDSLSQAFVVASTSLLISALIGMLLTTWLAGRASSMNSPAVFAGLMFWGWLWGIPGLLLGTPLMMATKVMADRIPSLNWLGTFLGDAPKRETKSGGVGTEPAVKPIKETTAEGLTDSAANGEITCVAAEIAVETAALIRNDDRDDKFKVDELNVNEPAASHFPEALAPARLPIFFQRQAQ
jgi:predicted PurR-regulated permease PerM